MRNPRRKTSQRQVSKKPKKKKNFVSQLATKLQRVFMTTVQSWTVLRLSLQAENPQLWLTHLSQQQQLVRRIERQKPMSKGGILRDIPRILDFDGLDLCSYFSRWWLPTCWIPWPEWYFHHGIICVKFWELLHTIVVPRMWTRERKT